VTHGNFNHPPTRRQQTQTKKNRELGWMIDPEEKNIFVISSDRRIQMFREEQSVTVLSGMDLNLTVNQIFDWLSF